MPNPRMENWEVPDAVIVPKSSPEPEFPPPLGRAKVSVFVPLPVTVAPALAKGGNGDRSSS